MRTAGPNPGRRRRGQAKGLVEGGEFDFLAFASAVNDAWDLQFPEDGDIAAVMDQGKSLDGRAFGGLGGGPEVVIAMLGDEESREGQYEVEQLSYQVAFDLIDPAALFVSASLFL